MEVPCIDFSSNQDVLNQEIHNAFRDYGVFYIYNHGVSKEMIENCYRESKNFFNLPIDEKKKIQVEPKNKKGYQPINTEALGEELQTVGDYKEVFLIGNEYDENHPKNKLDYHGYNKWPDKSLLPNFRSTIEAYYKELENFGFKKLLPAICKALNIPQDVLDSILKEPIMFMSLLHYTAHLSVIDDGKYSCGAHTDFGLLTILSTDNNPGLQLYLNDTWIDADPKENMFFINLGDMLALLTNGQYKATIHRVVNKTGVERYSMPLFLHPDFNAKISPLPQFITDKNKVLKPVVFGNHVLDKFKRVKQTSQ